MGAKRQSSRGCGFEGMRRFARKRRLAGKRRAGLRSQLALAAALLGVAACSGEESAEPVDLYAQGETVYKNVCVACHDADPSRRGSLGPAIAGSSRELIEARVVHGKFPPGYTPKEASSLMPAFPHLAGSVDALAAYLAEAGTR